jgi:hypothetical protein
VQRVSSSRTSRDSESVRAEAPRALKSRVFVATIALAIAAAGVFVVGSAFGGSSQAARTPAALDSPTPGARNSVAPIPQVTIEQSKTIHVGQMTAAVEAFGSQWTPVITNQGEQELLRIDPSSGRVRERYPVPSISATEWGGGGITAGAGSIWLAGTADHRATVFRLDPDADRFSRIALDGKAVLNVAFDGHDLWAVMSLGADNQGAVVQLDPTTDGVVSETRFEAAWFEGILPADGTVWVLERSVRGDTVEGGMLARVDPGGVPRVALGGSFAEPVTDGTSIWAPFYGDATAMNLSHGIARIDPSTGEVLDQWKTDPIGYDMVVGPDGGIWFLGSEGLERLDPSMGDVDVTERMGGTPIFITATNDGLLVGTYEGDLLRFDVRASP